MSFTAVTATSHTIPQQQCKEIFYTEFHPYQSRKKEINKERKGKNSS
jgi:hypothetical protein